MIFSQFCAQKLGICTDSAKLRDGIAEPAGHWLIVCLESGASHVVKCHDEHRRTNVATSVANVGIIIAEMAPDMAT